MATKRLRSRIRRRVSTSPVVPPAFVDPVPTPGVAAPPQVTGLQVGAVTSTSAELRWGVIPGAVYKVELHRPGGTRWGTRVARPAVSTYTVTSLTVAQGYEFRVSARYADSDFGPPSVVATATTLAGTGSENPRGEGLNDEPRPVFTRTTGGPLAGTFDVLDYDWNAVGRSSTAPLVGPSTDTADLIAATGTTMTDRKSGWEGYLKVGRRGHLTQSHIISRATTDYGGTTNAVPSEQGRVSWCSSEPGPVTQKLNGPLHVDHCYITTADDGWRPVVNSGQWHPTGQYTWIHRPYGRSLLPDGTPSEAHHDGLQAFGLVAGASFYRCVIEGFSVGIFNTTAETAAVTGLLVEECWLENDRGLNVLHYGSKVPHLPPIKAGNPTWMTYKNCLIGPLLQPNGGIIGTSFVMRSEAERDAMAAAGVGAVIMRRDTDPKTGQEYKLANGKYAMTFGSLLHASQIPVFENIRWAGREFLTGIPDPDPSHTPGAPVDWGDQMVTWPPKPLSDGTIWWQEGTPRFWREAKTATVPTVTAAETREVTLTWTDPPQTTGYEARVTMSAWSGGRLYPELVSQSATGVVVRMTATGSTAALTAAQRTVSVSYREGRPSTDYPARPTSALVKMAS